jgi:predicted nucleic acid-binding protein
LTLFLADSSIWTWAHAGTRPDISDKLAQRLERDQIGACVPVALEVLHRTRTGIEYETLFGELFAPLDWLPLTNAVSERALSIQRELASASEGLHRRAAADYLIAAIAEAAGGDVVLWAFDRDLDLICSHTGQPFETESAPS